MKFIKVFSLLTIAGSLFLFTSCGVKKMIKKQDKITYQINNTTPESRKGATNIQIKTTFPEKYFNKKASLTSIPALKNQEGQKDTLKPIYFQGEKANTQGSIVEYRPETNFSSTQDITYKANFKNNVVSISSTITDKKGNKYPLKEREIGTVNIDTKREDIKPAFTYKTDNKNEKPTYYFSNHNYVPSKPVEKSATIYFDFNCDNLNWQHPLNKKEENIQMLKELFPFIYQYDSIKSVEVDGWASPEGELKRNEELSSNRAKRGKEWFESELNKYIKEKAKTDSVDINSLIKKDIRYKLKDNGEDWDGFLTALSNSNIKEKNQIINVIQSQSDMDKKEQQIRNMIAIYDEVDAELLPALRRAKIKVTCIHNLKSDELIAKYAVVSPDSLTNDELLYAASFTDDIKTKKQIFEKAMELYPEDYRAYNDLACIKIAEGNIDEAETLLKKANSLNPNSDIVYNNLGLQAYQTKDYDNAEKHFIASQNLGINQENNLFLVKDTIFVLSVDSYEVSQTVETETGAEKVAEEKDVTMAIKLNALLAVGVLNPAFEVKLSKHFSLQFDLNGTYWNKGFLWTNKPIKLFTAFLEARYYPKEVFKGFFVGLNTGFGLYDMSRAIISNFWNESHNGIMHKGWNYMAGATIGWAFPLKNNWGIEPFIGAGYTYAKYDNFVNNQLVSSEKAKHLFAFTYKGGLFIYYKF